MTEYEEHTIEVDGFEYTMTKDPHTGDWAITSEDDEIPTYVTAKDGAIGYIMEHSGVKEYGGYRIAPDRTSA